MATDIQETVAVGGFPGDGQGDNAQAPKTFEAKADPRKEYAAGGGWAFYQNMPRALPFSIDELAVELGSDVYDRMLLDAQCRGPVNVLKASILEDGATLFPAVDSKSDPNYDQAKQLTDDADTMLADLSSSFHDILWDMLDCVALGYRMAEQVYDFDASSSGVTQYTLSNLAVKPRESTAFVVDAYTNVLGIIAKIPGQAWNVQQGSLLTDLQDLPNFLPRSKFAILSFRPKNGDPRGTSVLRAAFNPWNIKSQLYREYVKYLTQFATPSMVGFTPENADQYTPLNPDGTPMLDVFGNPVVNSPQQDMMQTMTTFQNASVMAFAFGAQVQPIEMSGDGAPFLNAFAYLDVQITKAILHQTLATEEGQHQTRASSGTHKDMLDTIVRQTKRPVEQMIRRDILETWVRLNHGDAAVKLTPKVSLGEAEQEDLPRLMAATSALYQSGYPTPSQLPWMDKKLGFKVREEGEKSVIPTKETIMDSLQTGAGATGKAETPPEGNPALGKGSMPPPDSSNANSER